LDSTCYDVIISTNLVHYPSSSGISVDNGKQITVNSNMIRVQGSGTKRGIDLKSTTQFAVTGNVVAGSGVSGSGTLAQGILVSFSSSVGVISSNTVLGDATTGIYLTGSVTNTTVIGNVVKVVETAINEDSSSDYNLITGNYVMGWTSNAILFTGIHDAVMNNPGYNPKGHMTSPFDTTNNLMADSGSSATPNNATITRIVGSPKLIMVIIGSWTAGHTLVIQIDGAQVVSVVAPSPGTTYSFYLYPGETFYCQYQSGQTTFAISAE
jgi:parallel beta-helix repeat protein